MSSEWGFGVAMLPAGALYFYQAHAVRTVLPLANLGATLCFTACLQSLGGHAPAKRASHKPYFRQAHWFRAETSALPQPTCTLPHEFTIIRGMSARHGQFHVYLWGLCRKLHSLHASSWRSGKANLHGGKLTKALGHLLCDLYTLTTDF